LNTPSKFPQPKPKPSEKELDKMMADLEEKRGKHLHSQTPSSNDDLSAEERKEKDQADADKRRKEKAAKYAMHFGPGGSQQGGSHDSRRNQHRDQGSRRYQRIWQ
jgi:hypothetical protein